MYIYTYICIYVCIYFDVNECTYIYIYLHDSFEMASRGGTF